MVLTDIDGIQFELDPEMIREMHRLKAKRAECTEVLTIMEDRLLVKETPAQIMGKIIEEAAR